MSSQTLCRLLGLCLGWLLLAATVRADGSLPALGPLSSTGLSHDCGLFAWAAPAIANPSPVTSPPATPGLASSADASPAWTQFNALVHRWLAVALAVIFFLRGLWRFWIEGEFAEHGMALVIHLGLLVLLGVMGFANWGGVYGQMAWFAGAMLFGLLYTNRDLAEHRSGIYFWLAMVGFTALLGIGVGGWMWRHFQARQINVSLKWCILTSCFFTCWIPVRFLVRKLDVSLNSLWGGFNADLIFSEGAFAERLHRAKEYPSELLLRHWRDTGRIKKAYRKACRHLADDPRAVPVWFFALETAALHLRTPAAAIALLRRLEKCREISNDSKLVARMRLQEWAHTEGFHLPDRAPLDPKIQLSSPNDPLQRIQEWRRNGRKAEAETQLLQWLEAEPANVALVNQLVQLYAQDFKHRGKAEKAIARAEPHLSWSHVEYLRNSLEEWLALKPMSARKLELGPSGSRSAASGKIVLQGMAQPAAETPESDPLAAHVRRLRETRSAQALPPSAAGDPVDQLLAESRYGTAVDLLKKQLKANPGDFELWMRYAEVQGRYCANLRSAEKIVEHLERSRRFSDAQLKQAQTRLREWRAAHRGGLRGW